MAKKIRRDAKLMSLPAERQAEVIAIATDTGITRKTLDRLRDELGIVVGSAQTLSKFWHWYHSPGQRIEREIASRGSLTELIVEKLRATKPGFTEEELFSFGQRMFAERAIAMQDPAAWVAMQGAQRDREKVVLKEQEIRLAEQKFRRETCELFLKWYEERQAQEIAGSAATHAEKIERLGQLMFGEGWK